MSQLRLPCPPPSYPGDRFNLSWAQAAPGANCKLNLTTDKHRFRAGKSNAEARRTQSFAEAVKNFAVLRVSAFMSQLRVKFLFKQGINAKGIISETFPCRLFPCLASLRCSAPKLPRLATLAPSSGEPVKKTGKRRPKKRGL